MKRAIVVVMVLCLVSVVYAQDLNKATNTEIVKELFDVTDAELGEALLGLGHHQSLMDASFKPRPATVDELVEELRGRVNAWIIKRKDANLDTTTSVWSK